MAEITSAKAMLVQFVFHLVKHVLFSILSAVRRVADAIAILKFTPNKAARIVEKILNMLSLMQKTTLVWKKLT